MRDEILRGGRREGSEKFTTFPEPYPLKDREFGENKVQENSKSFQIFLHNLLSVRG